MTRRGHFLKERGEDLSEKTMESILGLLDHWRNNHQQGTLVFSSRPLMNYYEEHILSKVNCLGGVKFTLLAGFIETITGVRSEERLLWAADQELIIWGLFKEKTADSLSNPFNHTNLSLIREIRKQIKELKQQGITPDSLTDRSWGYPAWLIDIYRSYQELLEQTGWRDTEEAIREATEYIKQNKGYPMNIRNVAFIGFGENSRLEMEFRLALSKWGDIQDINLRFNSEFDFEQSIKVRFRPLSEHVEFCIGSNREWEVRGIARQIITYFGDGIPPSQIAVVFRRLDSYLPIVKRIFKEFDIPCTGAKGLSWRKHPMVQQFLQYLRVWVNPGESTEMLRLLSFIGQGEDGRVFDRIKNADSSNSWLRSHRDWPNWLRKNAEIVEPRLAQRMIRWADRLSMSPPEGLEAWLRFTLEQLRYDDSLNEAISWLEPQEQAAMESTLLEIQESIASWIWRIEHMDCRAMRLSPEEFLRLLSDLLLDHQSSAERVQGGVKILSPQELRGAKYKAILVGGLTEGDFPANPILPSLFRIDDLHMESLGYKARTHRDHLQGERELFRDTINAAESHLFLTRPESDGTGRSYVPSVFWCEINDLVKENHCLRYSPGTRWLYPPISRLEQLCFLAKISPEKGRLSEVGDRCQAEAERRRGVPNYAGYMTSSEILRQLASKFGEEYAFSITALEEYAQCPYAFFCRRVLGVETLQRPNPMISALDKGLLYHDILRSLLERFGDGLYKEHFPLYIAEIDRLLDQTADAFWEGDGESSAILRRLQKEGIRQTLREFVAEEIEWEERIDGLYRPALFEAVFSLDGFCDESGASFRLAGKVDRVDKHRDGSRFIVYDYKTGRTPTRREIEEGLDLQLLLYLRAIGIQYPTMKPMGGAYYSLKKKERNPGIWRKAFLEETGLRQKGLEEKEWDELFEQNLQFVKDYVSGIRAGKFNLTLGECGPYCAYQSVCRRGLTGRPVHDPQ